jgi:hypothetical protein
MKKINISHIESKLFNKRNLSIWWDLEKYPYPLFTPKKEEHLKKTGANNEKRCR